MRTLGAAGAAGAEARAAGAAGAGARRPGGTRICRVSPVSSRDAMTSRTFDPAVSGFCGTALRATGIAGLGASRAGGAAIVACFGGGGGAARVAAICGATGAGAAFRATGCADAGRGATGAAARDIAANAGAVVRVLTAGGAAGSAGAACRVGTMRSVADGVVARATFAGARLGAGARTGAGGGAAFATRGAAAGGGGNSLASAAAAARARNFFPGASPAHAPGYTSRMTLSHSSASASVSKYPMCKRNRSRLSSRRRLTKKLKRLSSGESGCANAIGVVDEHRLMTNGPAAELSSAATPASGSALPALIRACGLITRSPTPRASTRHQFFCGGKQPNGEGFCFEWRVARSVAAPPS